MVTLALGHPNSTLALCLCYIDLCLIDRAFVCFLTQTSKIALQSFVSTLMNRSHHQVANEGTDARPMKRTHETVSIIEGSNASHAYELSRLLVKESTTEESAICCELREPSADV